MIPVGIGLETLERNSHPKTLLSCPTDGHAEACPYIYGYGHFFTTENTEKSKPPSVADATSPPKSGENFWLYPARHIPVSEGEFLVVSDATVYP